MSLLVNYNGLYGVCDTDVLHKKIIMIILLLLSLSLINYHKLKIKTIVIHSLPKLYKTRT